VEAVDENDADLILLGGLEEKTSFRDAISRNHREIMRNAKCSILVVKEPEIDYMYRKL